MDHASVQLNQLRTTKATIVDPQAEVLARMNLANEINKQAQHDQQQAANKCSTVQKGHNNKLK